MQNKLPVYVKFLGQEIINPITILTACLIGAAINAAQGKDIFFSAVPYVIPLLVQGFVKASLKFKIKDIDLLCQLPAERKDPAFVSDQKGRIIFLNVTNEPAGKLNVVVGDVSGHGIAAGLLMATAPGADPQPVSPAGISV